MTHSFIHVLPDHSRAHQSRATVQKTVASVLISALLLSTIATIDAHASEMVHNTQIPAPVVQKMQEIQLSSDELSFIVTPLSHGTYDQGKLPLHEVQQRLEKQLEEQLKEGQKDFASSSHAVLEKNAKKSIQLQELITTLEPSLIANPLTTSYQHLANKPRTPASTMKLIPTFIGLDTLGKDFTWTTTVYHTGYRIGDTLYGDLIIKGSGDPKFTHEKLARLLNKVAMLGLTHIDGDIVIDSSVFFNVTKNPATFDNDPLRPYNASPDGFLVNFSTMTIDSKPVINNASKSQLVYSPVLADIQLPQNIAHRRGSCQSITRSLAPVWRSDKLVFNKAMPTGCGRHSFYIAYPDAKVFAQQVVKAKWLAMGNTLTGDVKNSRHSEQSTDITQSFNLKNSFSNNASNNTLNTVNKSKSFRDSLMSPFPIAREHSFPLSEQIYDINHYSNNVMTEQLLLSIPVYKDNNNRVKIEDVSSYPKAINAINDWWQNNLTTQHPSMTNGSGLCRSCTVTVHGMNDMLNNAYSHKDFGVFINSLGVAGISGTITTHKYRRPESAAIGRAWIKTGTLNNVTAMAGYIKGQSGQEYSVVAIINLPKGKRGANGKRPVLDTLIDWVAQH